jgi:multidrug efflux pump subunit AcrA (membrane-fusion protein)
MNIVSKWARAAATVAVGAGGWYLYARSQPHAPVEAAAPGAAAASGAARAPQSVAVFIARQQDMPVTLEATGNVVALNSVELRPQVSAVVQTVAFQEGQNVRRGDLLFSFDDRAERANLERVQAQVARDRATLADLERQYKRALELKGENFISQSAVDAAQTQVEAQRATLQVDQAAVRSAEVALSLLTLRAPLSGRAGAVTVSRGSLVQPAGAPLVTISQMDPIGVSFSLPETQLAAVQAAGASKARLQVVIPSSQRGGGASRASVGNNGDNPAGSAPAASAAGTAASINPVSLDVRPAALAAPAANPASGAGAGARGGEQVVQGEVSFVDNAIDSSTGTIRVKGSFANAQQALWPGQFVKVRIILRTLKDAVVVPQAALVIRGNERSVYVIDAEEKAQMRAVQARFASGELVAVDGIAAGERVIVDGKQNLRPGTPVKVGARGAGQGASGASGAASAATLRS